MAPKIEIVDAKRYMCGRIARQLRHEHLSATMRIGKDAHRGLREVYDRSFYRKAAVLDGDLAGMWGAMGNLMSPSTFVWMAITERATRYPLAVTKIARTEMTTILGFGKQELTTTIIAGDAAAKRLAVFLGWHVTDEGQGASAESRYGRKRLTEFLDTETDLLRPFGGGHAIVLGWHKPYDAPALMN